MRASLFLGHRTVNCDLARLPFDNYVIGVGIYLQRLLPIAFALVELRSELFLVAECVLQNFLRESRTGAFGARDHLQELASRLGIPLRRGPEHASNQGLHRRHFSDLVAFANRDLSRRLIQSDDVQTILNSAAHRVGNRVEPLFLWPPLRIPRLTLLKLMLNRGLAIVASRLALFLIRRCHRSILDGTATSPFGARCHPVIAASLH